MAFAKGNTLARFTGMKHKPESNLKRSETIKRMYLEGKLMGFRSEKGKGYTRKPGAPATSGSFSKGTTPWNKGTKGLQVAWCKGKKIPQISGPNNHNWKGGVTEKNHKIRTSLEFKKWRLAVFTRDNYTCRVCDQWGGTLHAHHINKFSKYPKLRLRQYNGITLCKKCHKLVHSKNILIAVENVK